MTRSDKSKRDETGTPFRYECAIPIDDVVQALMRLDRPPWLLLRHESHLEADAVGYGFRFRQLVANRMTSEINAYIWETDAGTTMIEGVSRKLRWTLTFLFLITLIFAVIMVASFVASLLMTPPPHSSQPIFGLFAVINVGLWGATFFYALRRDTVYHVEKVLQQLQTRQMQSGKVKSRPRLEEADSAPDAQENLYRLSDYEDDQIYDQKR